MRPDFDVAVIGGGPAGAAAASYLAKAGARCVVLERERFPRPHVGESLVPATTRVFRDLDFLGQMEAAGFPRKYGAAWTTSVKPAQSLVDWKPEDFDVDVAFGERAQEGVGQDHTYHVDRAKFDEMLLRHAAKLGATVREDVAVTRAVFDQGLPRVEMTSNGKTTALAARLIIDASGRRTLVGNQLGLRVKDPVFDQYALHAWFEGLDRGGGSKEGYIFIHFLPLKDTWVWQIPITETVTSVGVVTQRKSFAADRVSREEFFWECLKARPDLYERVKAAKQQRPLKEEGDYSYAMRQSCGAGYALIGDAARFVDPIFSSGVSIALNGARQLTRSVLPILEKGGTFDEASLAPFSGFMKRGTDNWYRFINLYYRLNVLFTHFVKDPEHRLHVLKLLQGDLYDEQEPAVLSKMQAMVEEVERDAGHPWHRMLRR